MPDSPDFERIRKLNPKIMDNAKHVFGTTEDYREAGYILPDGSMLDFSEQRNGGQPHTRNEDHRDIKLAIKTKENDNLCMLGEDCSDDREFLEGNEAMDFFEREGALRVFFMTNQRGNRQLDNVILFLNTYQSPTPQQVQRLRTAIRLMKLYGNQPEIDYTIYDDRGNTIKEGFYENANPSDVERVIRDFMSVKVSECPSGRDARGVCKSELNPQSWQEWRKKLDE